jgi:site-specific recombinase XerC
MGAVLSDAGRQAMTRRVVRGAQASLAAVQRLLSSFFGGRNAGTSRAYQADLESLAGFVGSDTVEGAVRRLMDCGHGELNALVLEYRAHLSGQGLAAATINRRLAAVRSLLRRARLLGLTPWTLEVANLKTQPYRDTRGLRVTPHGLRHAAITSALDLTKGDVRAVQRFSRHRDVRVINVYDDSREDLAGVVARLVAVGGV